MRTVTRLALPFLALAMAAATGCDPKKLDSFTDDTGGTNSGGTTDSTVTSEALAVGNILSLEAEIVHAGVALAAQYDTASAATFRGVLAEGCFSMTESDSAAPVWAMSLDGCSDSHGTTYRGGGEFAPVDSLGGYGFFPWGEPNLIRASNDSNVALAHDWNSGSLDFVFTRTSGQMTGIDVTNVMRHTVQNETVTFSYASVHFTGSAATVSAFPDGGSIVHVAWNTVGIFDVTFGTGGAVTYSIAGKNYSADLATGDVRVVTSTN